MKSELQRFRPPKLHPESFSSAVAFETDSVYFAMPSGRRAFAWFTFYKDRNVCFLVPIKQNKPCEIFPCLAAFNSSLSLGTVLHGTLTVIDGANCFFADNLYLLKGRPVPETFGARLKVLQETLATCVDNAMCSASQTLFYLPPMSYFPTAFDVPYPIHSVKCFHLKSNKTTVSPDVNKVLLLSATETGDTYLVHDGEAYVGVAGVNTAATSRLMASALRTTQKRRMFCRWHPMHEHWVPIRAE